MEKTVSERKTQNTHLPKRVAAYCRVAARGTDPSYGLDAQRAYYIQKINENPDWKMAGIYADEGLVGSAAKNGKSSTVCLPPANGEALTSSLQDPCPASPAIRWNA